LGTEKLVYMKNVLIKGANKGIGFETAKQLAHGYFIFLDAGILKKGTDCCKLAQTISNFKFRIWLLENFSRRWYGALVRAKVVRFKHSTIANR